ncbi:MAG: C40 family peptidase [Spirochaetales bacterium]|nr:C40 family peptidase [Spirochaetales bacterium]
MIPARTTVFRTVLFLFCVTVLQALPSIDTILDKARIQLGSPYESGAAGPASFDCSGFIFYLYRDIVPGLPRQSSALVSFGQPVASEALLPGDILLYATTGDPSRVSHVALYLGNESIIHAISDGPNRGVTLTSTGARYWRTRFHSARRVLPAVFYTREPRHTTGTRESGTVNKEGGYVQFAKGSYSGELKYAQPHGDGVFEFTNGDVYRGGFSHGEFHGQGTYLWKDGTEYRGSFTRGKPAGILPGGKTLYMQVEDSPWETWDGNVWGDFYGWRTREQEDFEAYKQRDRQETEKRR